MRSLAFYMQYIDKISKEMKRIRTTYQWTYMSRFSREHPKSIMSLILAAGELSRMTLTTASGAWPIHHSSSAVDSLFNVRRLLLIVVVVS